ncbi:YigZ family protein [Erysipelothrix sp. D19-032]
MKKEHPKATHHCSAYVVGEIERSNDDGEPSSSAGLPMLQVLRGNKMNYVIAVVVRYYGGILLGVGGLIRAYGSSVTLGIREAEVLVPQRVFLFRVSFPYEFTNDVEVYAGSVGTVMERQYDTLAVYDVRVLSLDALDKPSDVTRGMGHKELIRGINRTY